MDTFLLSNLSGQATGLGSVVIWVANKGRATHSRRVRVSNIRDSFALGDYFALTLDDEFTGGDVKFSVPEMSRIKEWVLLNRDVLLDYWLEKRQRKT